MQTEKQINFLLTVVLLSLCFHHSSLARNDESDPTPAETPLSPIVDNPDVKAPADGTVNRIKIDRIERKLDVYGIQLIVNGNDMTLAFPNLATLNQSGSGIGCADYFTMRNELNKREVPVIDPSKEGLQVQFDYDAVKRAKGLYALLRAPSVIANGAEGLFTISTVNGKATFSYAVLKIPLLANKMNCISSPEASAILNAASGVTTGYDFAKDAWTIGRSFVYGGKLITSGFILTISDVATTGVIHFIVYIANNALASIALPKDTEIEKILSEYNLEQFSISKDALIKSQEDNLKKAKAAEDSLTGLGRSLYDVFFWHDE